MWLLQYKTGTKKKGYREMVLLCGPVVGLCKGPVAGRSPARSSLCKPAPGFVPIFIPVSVKTGIQAG